MLSECARAASLEEARFRVDAPNSLPRRIKIIALDPEAEDVIRRLARKRWNAATFMTTAGRQGFAIGDWLSDLSGGRQNLLDQICAADLVVTVSTAGASTDDAGVIAEACGVHRVMLTALVIDPECVAEASLLGTMVPLRTHAAMLVVAKGEEYVEAMLTALRA